MRIVIIGAGNAGRHLARTLCELNHDVVMIDERPEPLAELEAQLDILTICGTGAGPSILEKAELERADILVAVTNRDEVNILACAHAQAVGVKHRVARVSDLAYARGDSRLDLRKLGVDLVVSHKEECAREIFNIVRMPGAIEVVDLLGGRAVAVGFKISTTSPMIRSPLNKFPDVAMISKIRFIAALRGDELIIPRGDTQFALGDDVYAVLHPEEVNTFMDWACPDHPRFDKVIVGGGGELGFSLVRRLETLPLQIVLVEQNEERAEYCSGHLDKTLVLRGNLMDRETLSSAGFMENTAFISVTGDDENNIISCLLAQKEGASFTLAQVTKPEYAPIINSLSLLDRAVSPHVSLTNAILHFVRGQHVARAALLHNLPGELMEIELAGRNKWVGKAIRDMSLPDGAMVATVLRGEVVLPATGDLVVKSGDRLVLFARPEIIDKVEARFRK